MVNLRSGRMYRSPLRTNALFRSPRSALRSARFARAGAFAAARRGTLMRIAARAANPYLGAGLLAGSVIPWRRIAGKWMQNKQARKKIGFARNSANSKTKVILTTGLTPINSKTLEEADLSSFGAIASVNNRNVRDRNQIYVSGYKVCIEVKNNLDEPCYFHWAILSPKDRLDIDTNEFFRGMGAARGVAFDNSTLSSMTRFCAPINPDVFNVLWHSKTLLAGGADSSGGGTEETFSSGKSSYRAIRKWVPIKRQIRFDNSTDLVPKTDRFWLVFWADIFGDAPGALATTNAVSVSTDVRVSFRDTGTV